MAKIGVIEAEVRKAFNIKPKDGEDFDTYLKRICSAVDGDKSDIWDTLSDEAQTYLNSVSMALKKGEDLPAFPGEEGADEDAAPKGKVKPDAAEEEDEGDEPETTKKKKEAPLATKKKAVAKTTAKPVKGAKGKPVTGDVKKSKKADAGKPAKDKKKAAAPKKDKPAKKKEKSATLRIKELVFGKPDITSEQVAEKLKKEGFSASASTVASYRADFLHSMRYLKTEGVKGLPDLE